MQVRHRFLARSLAAAGAVAALVGPMARSAPLDARAQLPSMTRWLDRYAAGEFEAVARQLVEVESKSPGTLLPELESGARRWVGRVPEGGSARARKLTAAAFVLEAAGAPYFAIEKSPSTGRPARASIDDASRTYVAIRPWERRALLAWALDVMFDGNRRDLPKASTSDSDAALDHAERCWWLAAVALLATDVDYLIGPPEGESRPRMPSDAASLPAVPLLTRAQQRFPDEPRLKLARVFAEERRTTVLNQQNVVAISTATPEDGVIPPALLGRRPNAGAVQAPRVTLDARTYGVGLLEGIGAGYEALTSESDVRGEALVRLGYHLIRIGERARALETLTEAAKDPSDPVLQYLSYFFRGWVLHRQGDRDVAERDYREALRLHSASRQVKTLLAGILAERGDRQEAREVLGEALKTSIPLDDPWMVFHQGEYRLWPDAMVALRSALR